MTRLRFLMTVLGLLATLACSTTLLLSVGRAELARLGTAPDPALPGRPATAVREDRRLDPRPAPLPPAPGLAAPASPAPASASGDPRRHVDLVRRFPGGLQTEARLALQAGQSGRAFEVARELSRCQYFKDLRAGVEQRGQHALLARVLPDTDPAERARVDAFCQTAGASGPALMKQLVLLAAGQGLPDAVYWAYEEQLDPSGDSARLLGRWALAGQDFVALGKVLLADRPEALGLTAADMNVLRKASALLLVTPEYSARSAFRNLLRTAEEVATYRQAGVTTARAFAQLPAGLYPPVRFADLQLSPADEPRAQAVVDALVRLRRQQLKAAGG